MSEKFQDKYRIPSVRLQNWDYGWNAMYFVTICTQGRECYFGEINNGEMHLTEIGKIVESEWLKTFELRPDMNLTSVEYVVMPNHFHAIIMIGENEYNTKRDAQRDAQHDGQRDEQCDGQRDEQHDGQRDEQCDGQRDAQRDEQCDAQHDGQRDEQCDGQRDEQHDGQRDEQCDGQRDAQRDEQCDAQHDGQRDEQCDAQRDAQRDGKRDAQHDAQRDGKRDAQRRDAMHCVSTIATAIATTAAITTTTINESKNKFGPQSKNLASVIRGFKIGVTKNARQIHVGFAWQSRFYDHIIRNDESFHRISNYILNNPGNWTNDKFYSLRRNQ